MKYEGLDLIDTQLEFSINCVALILENVFSTRAAHATDAWLSSGCRRRKRRKEKERMSFSPNVFDTHK